MQAVAIQATGWCLPDTTIAVTDLPEFHTMSVQDRQLCAGLGIERVPADDTADSRSLAITAARRALAEAGMTTSDVDALILIEPRVPNTFLSSDVTAVQAALGATRAPALSVGGLGCASIAPALLTARGLLCADPRLNTVLVVHGSKPPTPRRYRHPVTVQGDCGFAVVLTRHGPLRILDVVLESDGDFADLFRVDYRNLPTKDWREVCADLGRYSFELAMRSRDRLTAVNRRLLENNGLSERDIAGYVCQNLSTAALRFYQEVLGVTMESECADNLRRFGHLGPADALLNLCTTLEGSRWRSGDRVVLFNVSPVAAWSATLVEITTGNVDEDLFL